MVRCGSRIEKNKKRYKRMKKKEKKLVSKGMNEKTEKGLVS